MNIEVGDTLHVEPSADLREALARAVASFGAAVRGQYALEWVEDRGAICIVQMNLRGKSAVCIEIANEDGSPRQATLEDIEDFKRQLHRRLTNHKWVDEHYAEKAAAKARWKSQLKDAAQETVRELIDLGKNRVTVDLGSAKPAPELLENGYRVTDRRVRHEV